MSRRLLYLLLALLVLMALGLAACDPSQEPGEEAVQEEEAPPPPEPAESPPLEEEPADEVFEIGAGPEGIVADPETGLVAVGAREPARILLVDGESGDTVSETELPAPTCHLALTGPGGAVLATAERSDELLQIRLPDGGILSRTAVQAFPHNAGAYGDRVFVINEFESTMSVIRDGEMVETVETPLWPGGVAITDGGAVAVLGVRGLAVELYDARTLESLGPTHVASGPEGRLYVADTRGGAILTYETAPKLEPASSTPLPGSSPYGVALDPRRAELWITLTAENALVRFDVATGEPREMERYPTVRQQNTVAVDSQSGRVYVASREGGELQVVDPA